MRLQSSLLPLIALAACAGKPVPTESTAAPAAPVAQEGAERRTITLDPSDMSVDEAAGIATFSPGGRVMSAEYTRYQLDLTSLKAALGGLPEAPVNVIITLDAVHVSAYTPSDPNLPSPEGGFRLEVIEGHVFAKAP